MIDLENVVLHERSNLDSGYINGMLLDFKIEPRLKRYCVPLGREEFPSEKPPPRDMERRDLAMVYFLIVAKVGENIHQRIGAGMSRYSKKDWTRLTVDHPREDIRLT